MNGYAVKSLSADGLKKLSTFQTQNSAISFTWYRMTFVSRKLEKENLENLRFMIDGAQRMTQMIQDLVAYSRVDTKVLAFEIVDLDEVVEHLEQLELAALLEKTGAIIEIPKPLPKVHADPVLLRQLLQNLIINGIKNRRDIRDNIQPQISIRAGRTAEDEIRIDVQDNGIGIEKKDQEYIFMMSKNLN
jgi:signal transduction histidine kinase